MLHLFYPVPLEKYSGSIFRKYCFSQTRSRTMNEAKKILHILLRGTQSQRSLMKQKNWRDNLPTVIDFIHAFKDLKNSRKKIARPQMKYGGGIINIFI